LVVVGLVGLAALKELVVIIQFFLLLHLLPAAGAAHLALQML
jgi:hypothetical protein